MLQTILTWDRLLFSLINKDLYNPVLFFFFELVTNVVDVIILILFLYWLFGLALGRATSQPHRMVSRILPPVFITALVTLGLKIVIHRGAPVPFILPWLEIQILPLRYAFPSGHTSRAFSLAEAVGHELPNRRGPLFAGAALIGFSRIYLGAHHPTDVIAGAALGTFISWVYAKAMPRPR